MSYEWTTTGRGLLLEKDTAALKKLKPMHRGEVSREEVSRFAWKHRDDQDNTI
jgi:hypothetical protein